MTARAATLGAPPKPGMNRGLDLGIPPAPVDAKNNIQKDEKKQLNVTLPPDKHEEIRIAAIREKKTLGEYVEFLHDFYQQQGFGKIRVEGG